MRCVRPRSMVSHSARDDARQQVVRENALGAFLAAVHGESDALVQKRHVGRLLAAAHLGQRHFEQQIVQGPIMLRAERVRRLRTSRRRRRPANSFESGCVARCRKRGSWNPPSTGKDLASLTRGGNRVSFAGFQHDAHFVGAPEAERVIERSAVFAGVQDHGADSVRAAPG